MAGIFVNPNTGDMSVSGTLSAGNMTLFRNRIINGDMRVDQRGNNGLTGAGASSSNAFTNATTVYSVDRWAAAIGPTSGSLCAAQTTLSDADQAAIGGTFTTAAAVGVAPAAGLSVYYPFDGDVNDATGNGNNLTTVGAMSYVAGRVGSNAVYLANDANVLATPTKATNRLTVPYNIGTSMTISLWFCVTKMPFSGYGSWIFAFGTSAADNFGLLFGYNSTTQAALYAYSGTVNTSATTININTWYHAAVVLNIGVSAGLYVNGALIGSLTASATTGLFGTTLQLGDQNSTTVNRPFAGFIDDFRIYNRPLSATEIAALANIAPVNPEPSTTGLTTRLTFDNTTADAQGTLTIAPSGTPVYTSTSKSGTACLNCTGTVIATSESGTLNYSGVSASLPITVSFWINANNPASASAQTIISLGSSTVWGLELVIYNGTIYVAAYISGTNYQTPQVYSISANTWYHICLTITSAGYEILYVNGVQVYSKSIGSATTLTANNGAAITNLKIGGTLGSVIYGFKGLIDDVRIYSRSLSPQEVTGLYYSYQLTPYVLYQQPIEGLNVADLAWGTSAAQSATVSAWIKNNTSNAQQFSISAGNAGAASTIAAITFENDISDTLGFLTNPVGTNVVYATSAGFYKVGTRALDFTANTAGGPPTSYITYNIQPLQLPLSVSMWLRPTAAVNYCIPFSIGTFGVDWVLNIAIQNSTQIYVEAYISLVKYSITTTFTLDTWIHVTGTILPANNLALYINGVLIGTTALPTTATTLTTAITTSPANFVRLGGVSSGNTYAYKGYLDDVRIYNRALTAAEVYTLYSKNTNSTAISQFLLPRSYLYTTPVIPAGTWQKIIFTIPPDTTDSTWAKDITTGVNLAICLGAGGPYVSSGTSGWASARYFTGTGVQTFSGPATNFLGSAGNSILLTGVQLERGAKETIFETRPYGTELLLCQRYLEVLKAASSGYVIRAYNITGGGYYITYIFKVDKRTTPTFVLTGAWNGTPSIFISNTTVVMNTTVDWGLNPDSYGIGGHFTAEL